MLAVNIDPHNAAAWPLTPPAQLYAEGFRGVRFTARATIQPKIDECVAAGLDVMAIITGESGGYVPWNAKWIQIHNEPDLHDDWPGNSPQNVADMWVLFRNTYAAHTDAQGVKWASPGFASGGHSALNYCRAFLDAIGDRAPWPDALAIHPYTLEPGSAQNLFDLFWNEFEIPVIATEWHHGADTGYIWNFQCMLNGDGLDGQGGRSKAWNSWFCYTDAMVPGFGLRDHLGRPKDEYYALLSSPCISDASTPSEAPDAPYQPVVFQMPGTTAGPFRRTPRGIILHGSRSGRPELAGHAEFMSTARYAAGGAGGLGWNATVGDDEIALHMSMGAWGWNARAASDDYLALELAQPVESVAITDAQVRAVCWFYEEARRRWPSLPAHFPTHADLDGNETGAYDGKTDVFRKGSPRTKELRKRIMTRLGL